MYEYVKGEVVAREQGAVVLEAGGIGYRLTCSASTMGRVPGSGPLRLYTHHLVRDERHELYGFADPAERHLFRQLLQVSGVGPAVAQALLSTYEPVVLASHIASGDLACLVRVKGIGKRTAERILVELRDRIAKGGAISAAAVNGGLGLRGDAILALCSLGLPRAEAERRVETVKGSADLELEEVVKQALL